MTKLCNQSLRQISKINNSVRSSKAERRNVLRTVFSLFEPVVAIHCSAACTSFRSRCRRLDDGLFLCDTFTSRRTDHTPFV